MKSFEAACGEKQPHITKDQAKAHMANLIRRGGRLLEVYRCLWCEQWHVGHRAKGRKTTKRRRR